MVNLYRMRTAAAAAVTVTLMACGGSSGGSAPVANPQITTANAPIITNVVLTSMTEVDFIASFADPIPGPTAGGMPPTTAKSMSSPQSVVAEDAVDCAVSGQVSLTTADATLDRLAAGSLITDDQLAIGFADCDFDNIWSYDGNFTYTVTEDSQGDISTGFYSIKADFSLDNLEVTSVQSSDIFTLNGNASRDLDTFNPADTSSTVTGTTISEQTPTETTTLSNFSVTSQSVETSPGERQYKIFGDGMVKRGDLPEVQFLVLESEAFEGTISIPQNGEPVQSNPTVGKLTISADDGGSVVIVPTSDPNKAQLTINPGNHVLTVPWADLLI